MRAVVIGSGPSGVHAAQTLLERGHTVVLLDVGRERPAPVAPGVPFDALAAALEDSVAYLLGPHFEGVVLPTAGKEYYGLPPSKGYVIEDNPLGMASDGFAPLVSLAGGGLAEAWTGGVYPFNDAELAAYPFDAAALAPHYGTVARRIGVAGERDDLARFFPEHDGLRTPLRLDAHSQLLVANYRRRAAACHAAGAWLGRSRIAVLTEDHDGRGACRYLGRCLWGCPHGALYTPSQTLDWLRTQPRCLYLPGTEVTHLLLNAAGAATGVAARGRPEGVPEAAAPDAVLLAAGALTSAKIYLATLWHARGERVVLDGLMDNQQILVPFISPGMLGRPADAAAYQYHQICAGFAMPEPAHYVHAQLTTLKTAMVHPVIASLPLDVRSATRVFRLLRAALGIANVNLHDTRRPACTATYAPGADGAPGTLHLRYVPPADDAAQIAAAVARMKRLLRRLGALVPPGMTHVRPKGASVHYAGLIPFGPADTPHTATPEGRSRRVPNCWFADGVTFPFLPAKNITFTLMANAVRIATLAT